MDNNIPAGMRKNPMNILEFWIAISRFIELLKPTEEGRKRRARRRRYNALLTARKKRDKGKWSEDRYREELVEIDRLYPVE